MRKYSNDENQCEDRKSGDLASVLANLGTEVRALNEIADTLESLIDRLYGPQPSSLGKAACVKEVSGGTIEELHRRTSDVEEVRERISRAAARLSDLT